MYSPSPPAPTAAAIVADPTATTAAMRTPDTMPGTASGTSTFYFHPHGAELARALQAELLHELRLRDLGVGRTSLAVLRRLTWMPAALTETMYMMVPAQEAALRDPEVQERIAEAHLRALERFLRERRASSSRAR